MCSLSKEVEVVRSIDDKFVQVDFGGDREKWNLRLTFHYKQQYINYSNNVLLLTRLRKKLEKAFTKFEEEAEKYL